MEHRRKSISTILRLFALAAAFICAAAFAVPAAAENGGEIPERDLYEFSIQAMEEGRSLRVWGLMRLTYVNRSEDTLYSVVLRLHANDVEDNCMGIGSVGADGRSAAYTLSGDGGILNISLPREIAPNESTRLFMRFDMTLPETGDRFGTNSTGYMLGNALPIAAMYENGAWRTEPYYSNGDSFYSRIADYKVAMQIPAKFALAHTGTRMSYDSGRAYETYYIAAPSVREFAFALIPNAATAEATARGGRVKVHALGQSKAHAAFGAECVANAIDFFSENIGEYPYSDIYVVPFDLNGGMEYPGLIMINKVYFKSSKSTEGALVMGHETAHQWFYGVVGSDQVYSPWLDESLVEYLGFDFLRQYAGSDAADALEQERYYAMRNEYLRTKRLDGSLEELSGADYFFMVYAYGHDFYAKLVNEIGSGAFYEGLKTYYNANYMGIGTKEKLIAAFSEAAGRDLTEWFEANIAPEAAQ